MVIHRQVMHTTPLRNFSIRPPVSLAYYVSLRYFSSEFRQGPRIHPCTADFGKLLGDNLAHIHNLGAGHLGFSD